mmetsp:Transcript_18314/g.29240  ORF Transcript_18314/g.29240 Transcript_18314/m.29240 type:complete len:281 (+) Transcript_18314:307-1149(+)
MMYTLGPCVCLCVQHGPHTQTQLTHVHTYTFAHIPARRTKTHPCKHLSEILQSKPRLFANTSSSVSTSICLYCLPILSISLSRSLALSLSRALPRTLSPSLSHWPYVLVVNTVLLALKQTATRCNKLQRTATHLRSGSSSKSLEQLAFVKRGPNRHSFASFIRHPRHRSTLADNEDTTKQNRITAHVSRNTFRIHPFLHVGKILGDFQRIPRVHFQPSRAKGLIKILFVIQKDFSIGKVLCHELAYPQLFIILGCRSGCHLFNDSNKTGRSEFTLTLEGG